MNDRLGAPPRSERRYDAVSGMSEREPVNVLRLRRRWGWGSVRSAARRYYHPLVHLHDLHRLDQSGALELGKRAEKAVKAHFDPAALEMLQKLRAARDVTYLVIRGLPTLPWRFPHAEDSEFPEEEKHRDHEFLRSFSEVVAPIPNTRYQDDSHQRQMDKREAMDKRFLYTDFVIAGLARMLGAKVGPRFDNNPNSPYARNFVTNPSEQQSSDLLNTDMALRFQQSTVEKRLPDSRLPNPGADGECCRYRIYLCVKNFLRLPVYLIPVQEVIDTYLCQFEPHLKQRTIDQLKANAFVRYSPRLANHVPGPQTAESAVLRDLNGDGKWIMSYDPERVKAGQPDYRECLVKLRHAIRRARRDAIRIELRPGDVLVVDNWRAMVSRREYYPTTWKEVARLMWTVMHHSDRRARKTVKGVASPPEFTLRETGAWHWRPHRWLRAYYGYRLRTGD
jgi:hypothetical protein